MYVKQIQQSALSDIPSRHLVLEKAMGKADDGESLSSSGPSFVQMIDGLCKSLGLNFWSIRSH